MKEGYIAFNILSMVGPDRTAEILEKSMEPEELEKAIGHKYFKREGTPGNYKYYYTEEQYKKEKAGEKSGEVVRVGDVELNHTSNIIPFYKELKKEPEKYKEAIKMLDDLGSEWDKVNRITLASKVVNAQNNLNNRQVKEEKKEDKGSFENDIKVGDKKAKNPHNPRFKFQKDTKVSFVKNGETINGVISDYDYNAVTFDKEYNVDYKKDGKTWTMIGVPEGKIKELNEDSKSEIYSKEQKEKLSQYQQMMDEYEEKAKELKLLDGWKPSFIANSVYKNFGEDSFINGGSIDAHFDIAKKETYFSVNVGYNSFTHEEEQKKFFPKLYELRDKKFSTAKGAEDALNSFISDWDKERGEILKKVKEDLLKQIKQ